MSTLLRGAAPRDVAPGAPLEAARTGAPRSRTRWAARVDAAMIAVAACTAVAAWLPFLAQPLSPDEAGFLHLAQHWHPGRSLYGDYWVDRPPLLIWLFDLAGHLGAPHHLADGLSDPGVKLLGAAATGISVTLVGVLARLLVPGRQDRLPRPLPRGGGQILRTSHCLGCAYRTGKLCEKMVYN